MHHTLLFSASFVVQCEAGPRHTLASMVCYYGKHYAAFIRTNPLSDSWTYFDDNIVREVPHRRL